MWIEQMDGNAINLDLMECIGIRIVTKNDELLYKLVTYNALPDGDWYVLYEDGRRSLVALVRKLLYGMMIHWSTMGMLRIADLVDEAFDKAGVEAS